ncbi:MAG: helix-turn-helix domain-containing protein [Chthoniobacterales bacterium]
MAPGALFFIPPGKEHSFLEQSPSLAICMVADLDGEGAVRLGVSSGWLPAEELARVRQKINNLAHHRDPSDGSNPGLELGPGATALLLLDSWRRACLVQSGSDPPEAADSSLTRRLLCSLDPGGLAPAPGEIARRVRLQQDYLNRLVRRGTGLTFGQWRVSQLLKATERELAKGESIGEAALRLGFSDPNYFSRWFRRQTGITPSVWQFRCLENR